MYGGVSDGNAEMVLNLFHDESTFEGTQTWDGSQNI